MERGKLPDRAGAVSQSEVGMFAALAEGNLVGLYATADEASVASATAARAVLARLESLIFVVCVPLKKWLSKRPVT
jgi:hypothetical protein